MARLHELQSIDPASSTPSIRRCISHVCNNALTTNIQVMHEVVQAAQELDASPSVRAIILTGAGDKAFAAGADIKEMQAQGYAQAYNEQVLGGWEGLRTVRKPLIAAVNGYALGGGCEVAMLCDIIVASDKASFGQVRGESCGNVVPHHQFFFQTARDCSGCYARHGWHTAPHMGGRQVQGDGHAAHRQAVCLATSYYMNFANMLF